MRAKKAPPTDVESLFKELKNRSPEIRDLFAHQADILRAYSESHLNSIDVSLELPTGSGKTLVGLLIGEYRRRYMNERTLYLCPTRQLAHQVGRHAQEYGIDARVFVGPKREYPPQDVTLYRSAKIIAISTYSGLFNTSPGLRDPQTIILDDAHGAETYIASMWSVTIDRAENPDLYSRVVETFEQDLPPQFVAALHQASRPRMPVKPEMIPFGAHHRNVEVLRGMLDSAIPSPEESDLYFSWSVVRDGLLACHVYVGWDGILIRPYIPPTLTHPPFANANQRVYMSATLGHGGELERATGIPKVNRIPTPKTYAQHGVGRRLFLFPDLAKDPKEYEPWLANRLMATTTPRTLVLCPTRLHAEAFRIGVLDKCSSTLTKLTAQDVEGSLEPFSESRKAALVLTRYDGIDLPGEDCRQLVMYGLPSKTNLQEEFLEDRLGLEVLLRERIRTRISQGAGRCTRSDTDYAAVIAVGRSLLDFCARTENQMSFHPEMRAEIRFALEQQPHELADLEEMMKSFLSKDEDWEQAEQDIATLRATEAPPDTTTTDALASIVSFEVDFAYALWTGDFAKAVGHARKVVDGLSGSRLAPYRAFWSYLVASAAHAASRGRPEFREVVTEFLDRATEACRTVSWFSHALKSLGLQYASRVEASELQAVAVEGIAGILRELGVAGPRFQRKMDEVGKLVGSTNADSFDRGLVELGRLLGYDSWKPEGAAVPDCVWRVGSSMAFLFEGKSEESPEGGISVQDCRQASGHLKWAKTDDRLKGMESVFAVLVSPRSRIDAAAVPHAGDVHSWGLSGARELFDHARAALVDIRMTMATAPTEEARDRILDRLIRSKLDPERIRQLLLSRPAAKLPRAG